MSEKTKKKKVMWQKYIAIVFGIIIGVVCGIFIANHLDAIIFDETSFLQQLFIIALLILEVCVAIILQTIIHEVGHLIFGMLTGYRFSSFRIFSFMWIKENGKLRLKRYKLAGTAGQCLLTPPEMIDGKIPVVLYNLGGSLLNAVSGLLFLGIYFIFRNSPIMSILFIILAMFGFVMAILNGVPLRMGLIDNDGYNALSLSKNSQALQAFRIQMKANEQVSKGVRLKDMPSEWFKVPSDEEMKNSMIAVIGVFACNRLIDEKRFDEAKTLMTHMLEIDSSIVGLHRSLLICDMIFCQLIGDNCKEKLDVLLDKKQKNFMQSMKKFPTVIRTEYAHALLAEKDLEKAIKIKNEFLNLVNTYPYPGEIEAEYELMQIAEKKNKMY